MNIEANKNKIIELLLTIEREGVKYLIDYLENKTSYFTNPASCRFHGNYEGGLAEHSINVMNLLKEKNGRYSLKLSDENIIIMGLSHDICKANLYKKSMKLRKNDEDKWIAFKIYVIYS